MAGFRDEEQQAKGVLRGQGSKNGARNLFLEKGKDRG